MEEVYYFWDKRLNKLGALSIEQRYSEGFVFFYNGKRYKCRYAQAAGKLYRNPENVPQYREELRALALERRKQR